MLIESIVFIVYIQHLVGSRREVHWVSFEQAQPPVPRDYICLSSRASGVGHVGPASIFVLDLGKNVSYCVSLRHAVPCLYRNFASRSDFRFYFQVSRLLSPTLTHASRAK